VCLKYLPFANFTKKKCENNARASFRALGGTSASEEPRSIRFISFTLNSHLVLREDSKHLSIYTLYNSSNCRSLQIHSLLPHMKHKN